MRLSLIIPTYNRPKEIRRLLSNLDLQMKKPDEVIIVDASPSEETKWIVKTEGGKYTYPIYYYKHEKESIKQRNVGISKAKCEIIGFTDDAIYEPDFLDKILTIFEEDADREIAGASGFIFQIGGSRIPQIQDVLNNVTDGAEFSRVMKPFANECLGQRIAPLLPTIGWFWRNGKSMIRKNRDRK